MEFASLSPADRFRRAMQECQIDLPPPPYDIMWRDFFLSLFSQVINNEENENRRYKHKAWDFCVIHSKHSSDVAISRDFVHQLETTLGIHGITIGDIARGENTLKAASDMVEGSTKVYVLCSKYLGNHAIPRFTFQSALMDELERPDWRCKIIPLDLPGPKRRPFFLKNIEGMTLSTDTQTVALVTQDISVEEQMQVRAIRDQSFKAFRNRLGRQRLQRLQEIREIITNLREEYGDEYDPNEQLPQSLQLINSLVPDEGGSLRGGQVINISESHGISIGPSFHFHGRQDDDGETIV